MLVLGSREKISAIWRFQNCRKHSTSCQQSRNGVDGHVLLTWPGNLESYQTDHTHVFEIMGSDDV